MTYGAELSAFEQKMAKPLERLQVLVANLDYQGISAFFNQYLPRDINYSSNCAMLTQMIVQNPDFFKNYQSLPQDSEVAEKLKKEHKLRYSYVLNHLTIHSQLFLLNHLVHHQRQIEVDMGYFKATHLHFENSSQKEKILEIPYWGRMINLLFRRENFTLIDKLEEQFNCSFLTQKSKNMMLYYSADRTVQSGKKMVFHYTDEDNFNSFEKQESIDLSHAIFKPYFYIIFEYSEEKEAYLHQKEIGLPTFLQVENIEADFNKVTFFFTDIQQQQKLWCNRLEEYKKRIYYYELDSHIEAIHGSSNNHDDNETSRKLKI